MSNIVLKTYVWVKSVFVALCLLALFLLSLFSVYVRPYDIINQATKQLARCEAIAKDVLILEYTQPGQSTIYTGAVSEIQGVAPIFQQEETFLMSIQTGNIKLEMSQVQSDYSPMSSSLKVVLSHIGQPIDPIQASIIMGHEHGYLLGINQVVMLMLQDLDGIQQEMFAVGAVIVLIVLSLTIADVELMRRHARSVKTVVVP